MLGPTSLTLLKVTGAWAAVGGAKSQRSSLGMWLGDGGALQGASSEKEPRRTGVLPAVQTSVTMPGTSLPFAGCLFPRE